MKRIRSIMDNLYWVGIKESEIRSCKSFFTGSITYIGTGTSGNISYTHKYGCIKNYNNDSDELDEFIRSELKNIIKCDSDAKFMFYAPSYAYFLGKDIVSHTVCLNSSYVLTLLKDKMRTRLWLGNSVPVLPTIAVSGHECSFDYFQHLLPGNESFILQGCTGAGGNDTYIVNAGSWCRIEKLINKHEIYVLSPYLQHSFSVNTHVLIGKDLSLLPSSIQIVEYEDDRMIYHGADFIEYRNVSDELIGKIDKLSMMIGNKIKNIGYKGILGIDYIISGNDVYFLEINPRFQASTPLINRALTDKGLPSVQEMVLESFSDIGPVISNYNGIEVKYSNYIVDAYDKYSFYSKYLKNAQISSEIDEVLTDGYCDGISYEERASLFSVVLNTNISSISPDSTLNIHDNIKPYKKKAFALESAADFLVLKTSLLVQGIQFSDQAKEYLQNKDMRKGTYSSVDIYLSPKLIINCPCDIKLCTMSPFTVEFIGDQLFLAYAGQIISKIYIDFGSGYKLRTTKNGVAYGDISFLASDRLRIHYSLGCFYKGINAGCKFCDVPPMRSDLQLDDVYEVIDWHLKHSEFRHILIGGGSSVRKTESKKILEIITYLRKRTDKNIYLMSVPPVNLDILNDYYAAGLNEVAFNVEIFDRAYAKRYMPGKGRIPLQEYQNALLRSVELWGNTGNVKCLLVYGCESNDSFLQGVQWLASHGIQPVISVFRPLRNTDMENIIPPEVKTLTNLFYRAQTICQSFGLSLGPDCILCQNNTLSIPTDKFSYFLC